MNPKAISSRWLLAGGAIVTLVGGLFQASIPTGLAADRALSSIERAPVLATVPKAPLFFEAIHSQTNGSARFVSRGDKHSLSLTPTEAVLKLRRSPQPEAKERLTQEAVLHIRPVGANPMPMLSGLEPLPGKINYFIGDDPAKWRTNVPTYAKVKYQAVYPGVDLVYYGNQGDLEFDFIVAPGTDPAVILLSLEGMDELYIDDGGDLMLRVGGEQVTLRKPFIYQEANGSRQEISDSYTLRGENQVGFQVGTYDARRPLVIDPVLTYSSYLGGSGEDVGLAVAVDSSGNAYLNGYVVSTDLPTVNPLQGVSGGGHDVFVAKLNAAGSAFLYVTYLGGGNTEHGQGIAVDASGNAYVGGYTESPNFPTANAMHSSLSGSRDAFVTKLNPCGSGLVYSTFLGGSHGDNGISIAVDSVGAAYVTGNTRSLNFPTANALQPVIGATNGFDAFVTKLNSTGSGLIYSTYLGGQGDDLGHGIALDASDSAHVTGLARSTDFPIANAFQPSHGGAGVFGGEAFVTKLNAAGSGFIYSSFLGGSGDENVFGGGFCGDMAVDASGDAYVAGCTSSTNFPTANPAQPALGSNFEAFVAKITDNTTPAFTFTGFFQPVDNLPVLNEVNAGRAIPVKFSLNGNQGLNIFAAGYPKSEAIACDSTALVNGIEETVSAGSSSLSYDPAADRYTYVWKTDKAWAGTCRQLVVKLSDNSFHRANFKFK